MAAAILMLPGVKVIDRALSLVKEWTTLEAGESLVIMSRTIEETLELAIPVLLIVALIQMRLMRVAKLLPVEQDAATAESMPAATEVSDRR